MHRKKEAQMAKKNAQNVRSAPDLQVKVYEPG